jgi:hypothetical protein
LNTIGKIVTGVCIFSTLFVGCYSSVLVDPTGDEKDKIYKNNIEMVLTKNGTLYKFDSLARVDSNAIVGMAMIQGGKDIKAKQVSIPLSDIQRVQVSQFNTANTVVVVVLISGAVAVIVLAASTLRWDWGGAGHY